MKAKSATFTVEITIATLHEELQTKETIAVFIEGMQEAAEGLAGQMASSTGGLFMATGKVVHKPEDWQ